MTSFCYFQSSPLVSAAPFIISRCCGRCHCAYDSDSSSCCATYGSTADRTLLVVVVLETDLAMKGEGYIKRCPGNNVDDDSMMFKLMLLPAVMGHQNLCIDANMINHDSENIKLGSKGGWQAKRQQWKTKSSTLLGTSACHPVCTLSLSVIKAPMTTLITPLTLSQYSVHTRVVMSR